MPVDDFIHKLVRFRKIAGKKGGQEGTNYPFTTGSAGGSMPHNNMQPYFVVNYIIYCGIAY